MTEMTYPRDRDKPVPAKPGVCDGCGERKPIVMVSSFGNYCSACSDDLYKHWQKCGQGDWNSRVKTMRKPDTGEPFRLQDDGGQ